MNPIFIGTKPKDGPVSWGSKNGESIFLDSVHNALWIWLPPAAMGDYLGYGDQAISLGFHENIGRGLRFIKLDPQKTQDIRKAGGQGEDVVLPSLTGKLDVKKLSEKNTSPLDYLDKATTPAFSVKQLVARIAAQDFIDVEKAGLPEWLKKLKWTDCEKALSAHIVEPIRRDTELFRTVKSTVANRRIVFLVAGRESGLSTFVGQLRTFLSEEGPPNAHLSADFSPAVFEEFFSRLDAADKAGAHAGLGNVDPAITALYISLAYSAYQSVIEAQGTELAALNEYVRSEAASEPNVFLVKYLGTLASANGDYRSQVEPFLFFVDGLMRAAGREKDVTIVLSFPGLSAWFRANRSERQAAHLIRLLWHDLQGFTTRNFTSQTDEPKSTANIRRLKSQVGLLVELQRLPLNDIGNPFCRQATLTLPPLGDQELARLWTQRTGLETTTALTSTLKQQTGGFPWFVDLLLDCTSIVKAVKGDGAESNGVELLRKGIEIAESVISGTAGVPEPVARLGARVDRFREEMNGVLSHATKLDVAFRRQLRMAQEKPQLLSSAGQAEDWLESGLVWICPPTDKTTSLLGFANFPYVLTHHGGSLVSRMEERVMRTEDA